MDLFITIFCPISVVLKLKYQVSKYIQQTFRTISATFLNFHGQPVWLISQCLTYMILRPSFSSKIFESSKISKPRKRGAISVATYCNWSLICHRLSSNSQDSRCYYIKVLEPKGARSSNSPNSFFCHAEMLMRLKKVVPLITYCATHCKVKNYASAFR